MTIIIRRNGHSPKPDEERLEDIREQIRLAEGNLYRDKEEYLVRLRERVREYERRYEKTSSRMMVALMAGEFPETADIALWAWTWQTLMRLTGETPTAGTR